MPEHPTTRAKDVYLTDEDRVAAQAGADREGVSISTATRTQRPAPQRPKEYPSNKRLTRLETGEALRFSRSRIGSHGHPGVT